MILLDRKLPKKITLACSGGVDSMAVLDFLRKKHDVTVAFFDHGTETSREAKDFIKKYCDENNIEYVFGKITREKNNNESFEEYWRNERYKFLNSLDSIVITCHHLDDCVETWVWSSMHGEGKIIPGTNKNVIRPFRLNKKQVFIDWCISNNITWIEDKSNNDLKYMRNFIRSELMPNILRVNPGIHKVIFKKIKKEFY